MNFDLAICTNVLATDALVTDESQSKTELELLDLSNLKTCASYNDYGGSLEKVIFEFLRKVESDNAQIFAAKTVLQVGAYYSPEETAAVNLKLSDHCLSELERRLIEITVCEYPWAE